MIDKATLPTYKRYDPVWYFEAPNTEPVPAIFIKERRAKRGVTIELEGSKQQQCSYANITRREVVEVNA